MQIYEEWEFSIDKFRFVALLFCASLEFNVEVFCLEDSFFCYYFVNNVCWGVWNWEDYEIMIYELMLLCNWVDIW